MEQLKEIIQEIDRIGKELKITFSTDAILENATRIYNTQFIQFHRQGNNLTETHVNKNLLTKHTFSATPNQIASLVKHGYKGDTSKLTREKASEIIAEGLKPFKANKESFERTYH